MKILNPQQQAIVQADNHAIQVNASAGSGKTSVIIAFIERILKNNLANPKEILLLTFTNKSAKAIIERLGTINNSALMINAEQIVNGTFHSVFCKTLRYEISNLQNYENSNFAIYEPDDSIKLVNDILKRMDLKYKPSEVYHKISYLKNHAINENQYKQTIDDLPLFVDIYKEYQSKLHSCNAMDFDDLLMNTLKLFECNTSILEKYQKKYKYIIVDEYQDTNLIQAKILKLLKTENNSILVVGDDYQSIYGFRGAKIENFLNFKNEFNAKVYELTQNYRSTPNIINFATCIIKQNQNQLHKKVFTENNKDYKIKRITSADPKLESQEIARQIKGLILNNGYNFKDFAILSRTKNLFSDIELALNQSQIPNQTIGNISFFSRAEIKDFLAFLKMLANPSDEYNFSRALLQMKGIADKTKDSVLMQNGKNCFEKLNNLITSGIVKGKKLETLQEFSKNIWDCYSNDLILLSQNIFNKFFVTNEKKENIIKFLGIIESYCKDNPLNLSEFLDKISLDNEDESNANDKVNIMTIHASKGLEFKVVFIIGVEDGILPSYNAKEQHEIEEECRLFYVAITRAEEMLFICRCKERSLHGKTITTLESRFIKNLKS